MIDDIINTIADMSGDSSGNDNDTEGAQLMVKEYWFFDETPIPQDIASHLIDGEQPVAAYRTYRDNAVFTTNRLIIEDKQGIRGKKSDTLSIPYTSITSWSTETSGTLDLQLK